MSETITCKNCGHPFNGRYCSHCGEKAYSEKDKSMAHVMEEALHFITHFDGTLFTSLKTIARKPGQMSLDYTNGIRKKYFKPVSLFLLLVVLYLLFPRFQGLNMHFMYYVTTGSSYRLFALPIAQHKMAALGISDVALAALFEAKSHAFAKIMLLLFLPLSGLALRLLYYRSRRYYFDHFILGTEIMSFLIGFLFLLVPAILWLVQQVTHVSEETLQSGYWVNVPSFIVFTAFIYTALKNFYGRKPLATLARSVLFLAIFAFVIMYIYKSLLYLVVMLFI